MSRSTALDVTIQAQILDLLQRLQRETGLAILLITHDLGVVATIADEVAVMYAGVIVERAPRATFFVSPRHPYSRQRSAPCPRAASAADPFETIPGMVPSLRQTFAGCRFADRCEHVEPRCRQQEPPWLTIAPTGVRCHRANDLPPLTISEPVPAHLTPSADGAVPAAAAGRQRPAHALSDPPRCPATGRGLRTGRGWRVAVHRPRPHPGPGR